MLGTVLPGLRHVRAPLIAGYLWLAIVLFFLEEEKGVEALKWIEDLADSLSPVTVGAASAVVAYLVGSASQAVAGGAGEAGGVGGAVGCAFGAVWARGLPTTAREACAIGLFAPLSRSGSKRLSDRQLNQTEFSGDVALLRAQILVKHPGLFGEIDRLRAEAELRFALVVPLSVFFIALAIVDGPVQSPAWLIGLLLPIILAVQGHDRLGLSNAQVVEAVVTRLIDWPLPSPRSNQ